MEWILTVGAFATTMAALSRVLRRMDREGSFDPLASSTVAAPGLRLFFDYSQDGFSRDGSRQLLPR